MQLFIPAELASNRTYRRLLAAQVIGLVGTGLTTVALALLAYDLEGGEGAARVLGIALFLKMAVYVFLAPAIVAWTGRLDRRRLLVALDLVRAGCVCVLPFVDAVWQIYVLIVVINTCAAGFTPTYQALLPDVLPDDAQYTRALSLSRVAYELEQLVSPALAAAALLVVSYNALFVLDAVSFLISAALVAGAALPARRRPPVRPPLLAGIQGYLRTPALRMVLALNVAVAAASAMIIVNTVVLVRDELGMGSAAVSWALAVSGAGAIAGATLLPRLLARTGDREAMTGGAILLVAGLVLTAVSDGYVALLLVWALLGAGLSIVQTPAGRIVRDSGDEHERAGLFAAQFSLSHACWLLAYPIAGVLGSELGAHTIAWVLAGIAALGVLASLLPAAMRRRVYA